MTGRILRATDDVVGRLTLTFEEHVSLRDGIGLGVDLLPVEMGSHLLALFFGKVMQRFFSHRQHPAGSAGAVVEQIRTGRNLVCNREKDQPCHELHRIAGGSPVFTGLLIVLLIEPANQLLEHGTDCVIIKSGGVFHRPSPLSTGFGLRLISGGESNFSISVPRASALERRGGI